ATPAAGSVFTGWSGDCAGTTNPCHVTMDQARAVTATFTALRKLTVTKTGSGSGSVSSSPDIGISCGATCSHDYLDGAMVTLTATADAGSTFTGWSGEGCSGILTCSVTMSQARNVSANFDTVPVQPPAPGHTLTVSKTGAGSGGVTSAPAAID